MLEASCGRTVVPTAKVVKSIEVTSLEGLFNALSLLW